MIYPPSLVRDSTKNSSQNVFFPAFCSKECHWNNNKLINLLIYLPAKNLPPYVRAARVLCNTHPSPGEGGRGKRGEIHLTPPPLLLCPFSGNQSEVGPTSGRGRNCALPRYFRTETDTHVPAGVILGGKYVFSL